MKRSIATVLLVAALFAAACSKQSGGSQTAGSDASQSLSTLSAEVASYEVLAGEPQRLLIGLFTPNGLVSYGSVQVTVSGPDAQEGAPAAFTSQPLTASFVQVPEDGQPVLTGDELDAASAREPEVTLPIDAHGVYQVNDLTLTEPGIYDATVDVMLADGSTGTASTAFEVTANAKYPAVGQEAPKTKNLTVDDHADAKLTAVDSRATADGVPDPTLHESTIAGAIGEGRPVVVVVSTPVYCQSRFCGPVTDEVQSLSERYGDVADFVHLEVWRDFQGKVVNEGAAQWVLRGKGPNQELTEPWIFLVDADGTIVDRWQNVLDGRQLAAALEALPTGSAAS